MIALYSLQRHQALADSRAGFPASAERHLGVDGPIGRWRRQTAGPLCRGAMIVEARWPASCAVRRSSYL